MTLTIGSDAPAFELPGVDGASHSLGDYADVPALAVIWSCNHCPYVQAWESRMMEIQRDYGERGVRLVAVSSNDAERYPEDSFDEMKARAQRLGFNFDYLYDEDQSAAKAFGPERTPEVFLFDRERKLVYHGAIDDSRDEELIQRHHLREALDAVLEGRSPAVAETPPVGCTVKWRS
jgi:peroxiredoxin